MMKETIKNIPILGGLIKSAYTFLKPRRVPFTGSQDYWVQRYQTGGNSGAGSYGRLANFKAEVLNKFVMENEVKSVIEYGCGDGNQLALAKYHEYLGFDVSPEAVATCRDAFASDDSKSFKLLSEWAGEEADLTLSLDVIYHLVEDRVFDDYMSRLFDTSRRFVCIYSSNTDEQEPSQAPHVRHRRFESWVSANRPSWKLMEHIPNKYRVPGGYETDETSFADFYFYHKVV